MGFVPILANSAKKLYVFQRTPSTVWPRENWQTDKAALSASLTPGLQNARLHQLDALFHGDMSDAECTAVEGLEVLTLRELFRNAKEAGITVRPEDIPKLMMLAHLRHVEEIRQHIEHGA